MASCIKICKIYVTHSLHSYGIEPGVTDHLSQLVHGTRPFCQQLLPTKVRIYNLLGQIQLILGERQGAALASGNGQQVLLKIFLEVIKVVLVVMFMQVSPGDQVPLILVEAIDDWDLVELSIFQHLQRWFWYEGPIH